MLPNFLLAEAETLLAACRAQGVRLVTAESCTGGLIAAALTAIAGSSDVVDRGFVTYSNEAKNELIGVPMHLIQADGAVSEPVARAMAEGALVRSRATIDCDPFDVHVRRTSQFVVRRMRIRTIIVAVRVLLPPPSTSSTVKVFAPQRWWWWVQLQQR